jgi:hypothetical protein
LISLIRVDFRASVGHVFANGVKVKIVRGFESAVRVFISDESRLFVPSGWSDEGFGGSGISAPVGVLDYPSFATLVNGFFGSFNSLRTFPVLGIMDELFGLLKNGLEECARALEKRKSRGGNEFNQACFVFCETVVPCICGGLERVFDVKGRVDLKVICRPIATYANVVMLSKLEKGSKENLVEQGGKDDLGEKDVVIDAPVKGETLGVKMEVDLK